MLARYHGVPADPAQLRHEFVQSGECFGVAEILRAARRLDLKARVADIQASENPDIPPISARLAELSESVIGVSTKAVSDSQEVTVLADKSIPFSVLKKVMATCTAQGYSRVSLAVVQKSPQSTSHG